MFIRRVGTLHKRAKEELTAIQMHQRAMAEQPVAKLVDVLAILVAEKEDPPAGRRIRALLEPDGSLARLRADSAALRLTGGGRPEVRRSGRKYSRPCRSRKTSQQPH